MPALNLTAGYDGRIRLGLPAVRQINAYSEASKGGPTGSVRTFRPGLDLLYTLSPGPIYRQYQQPGLFNGDLFSISGNQLYRGSTLIGQVAFGSFPRFAAANGQLAIVVGGGLFVYNGTTLTQIQFFDDGVSRLPPFSGVAVLYDIFVFPVVGSNEFFFSSVGDPTTINAANFSQAQVKPDTIVEVAVLAEELYFFKDTSVEIWDFTGQLTAPFALSQGRTYTRGLVSQSSVTLTDNGLFWVADDYTVYRTGTVPQNIATPYINDRIKACAQNASSITCLTFNLEGHVFYVMNLPGINESYAYDCQTQEWARWGTQSEVTADPSLYIGACAAGQGDGIFVGSYADGSVYQVDVNSRYDGADQIGVVVSAVFWIPGGVYRCNNVSLACVRGVGTVDIPDPIVKLRYSDDAGRSWSSWLENSLGSPGAGYYKATWWGLGAMQQPGRLFEFAVADPVNVTIEGASINEARP